VNLEPSQDRSIWDDLSRTWPWLEASMGGLIMPSGRMWLPHDELSVFKRLCERKAYLWCTKHAAFVTEIYGPTPTGLKTHHMWLAGGDKDEIVSMVPTLEDWGRAHGCHRQTGSGRRGWLREFDGYEEIGVRKQKSLLVAVRR